MDTVEASDGTPKEDLVEKFLASKSGWRRKPSTAKRQAQQLRNMFKKVAKATGETQPDVILMQRADDLEEVLRSDLPDHTALVKSNVIALLEFTRYVSVRQPDLSAEWASVIRRLEIWKRDASALDLHRAANVQDKMGEDGYLPSKEDLGELRRRTLEELAKATKEPPKNRSDAVKVRRLLTVSLLCDNFQRSGAVSNATIQEYEKMTDNILRVSEHKSKASYGSLNLVVLDQLPYLHVYVEVFRPMLIKDATENRLFPSAKVCDDVSAVCTMFGIRCCNPTLMRKAMSSAAYGSVSEAQRRQIANHMTHRPETAYRAYSAKNRRSDAVESVSTMNDLMYGSEYTKNGDEGEEGTIPSSAGAMQNRISFSPAQVSVLEKEARRLKNTARNVTMPIVLQVMARNKPMFDCRSPKCVEKKLRSILADMDSDAYSQPKRRRVRH